MIDIALESDSDEEQPETPAKERFNTDAPALHPDFAIQDVDYDASDSESEVSTEPEDVGGLTSL